MKGDAGKAAEREVMAWLSKESDANSVFSFHRLPDARAARGALAAQPADSIVVHRSEITFLEVKESAEKTRLPRAKVSQYGSLLKFHLAGARVLVVVRRSLYRDWVVLHNSHLFHHDETPASFPFAGLPTYPTAAAALSEMYS